MTGEPARRQQRKLFRPGFNQRGALGTFATVCAHPADGPLHEVLCRGTGWHLTRARALRHQQHRRRVDLLRRTWLCR